MKYLPLIWSGLWRSPVRTGLTFFSIVLAFILFGILASLAENVTSAIASTRKDVIAMYADLMSDHPAMPLAYRDQIEHAPGVKRVLTWNILNLTYQDEHNRFPGWPVNPADLRATYPEVVVSQAALDALARTPTGILIHTQLARKFGWKVGDTIPCQSNVPKKDGTTVWAFTVVGIYDAPIWIGIGGSVLPNFDYVDRARATDSGMAFEYDITVNDPDRAAIVGKDLDAMFANSSVPTRTRPFTDMTAGFLNSFDVTFFAEAVVGSGFIMLLMLSTTAMMEAVGERTQELAVLRSMGFSQENILALVLAEALIPCLVGAALGLSIALFVIPFAAQHLPFFEEMAVHVSPLILLFGMALAVVIALTSSLMPLWRTAQLDIVTALSGK